MRHRAFLHRLSASGYLTSIQKGLEWIKFGDVVSNYTRVFIKPNLTFPEYRPGVMTSPQGVEAAILAVREYTHHIYLGDADSGGYNRFSMDEVYRRTGLWEFAEKYGVEIVNLSKVERRAISFQYKGRDFSVELPRLSHIPHLNNANLRILGYPSSQETLARRGADERGDV